MLYAGAVKGKLSINVLVHNYDQNTTFFCKKKQQIKYGWFHSCDARHFESFACENCFVFTWHFHLNSP